MTPRKVTIIGDCGVGKSELLHRLARGSFSGQLGSTIASSYSTLRRHTSHGDMVGIWDTVGSERMSHFLPIYVRGSDLVLACFKMGDEESIGWLDRVLNRQIVPIKFPQIIVVATQCDRDEVQNDDWLRADTLVVPRVKLNLFHHDVIVTSAVDGTGVDALTDRIFRYLESPVVTNSVREIVADEHTPIVTVTAATTTLDESESGRRCHCIIS
jgi:small GTP-binding protein